MLDGAYPLAHVLVVSIYRVESVAKPPAERLLSLSGDSLHISKLPEAGVRALITASFPTTIDKDSTLISLIYAETEGSPLYIRTLLVTLVSLSGSSPLKTQVKEGVIFFDFESLIWRFDPLALQAHVSDKGVDSYIERVQSSLPAEVIKLLSVSEPAMASLSHRSYLFCPRAGCLPTCSLNSSRRAGPSLTCGFTLHRARALFT